MSIPLKQVVVVIDSNDELLRIRSVERGLNRLQNSLASRSVACRFEESVEAAPPGSEVVIVGGMQSGVVQHASAASNWQPPLGDEAFCLWRVACDGHYPLLLYGADARGLNYALLELADRIEHSPDVAAALSTQPNVNEQPTNRVRSMVRFFVSEVEDKPWFYDREAWKHYLGLLATNRFNRFSLTLASGYDTPRNITDSYFHFPFPFIIDVPGYAVRAEGISVEERQKNLETLQFIGDEATAAGLDFYIGIWNLQAMVADSPNISYATVGITPENHAAYCNDAMRILLRECSSIKGVTLRVNYESGVSENSYNFWEQVFAGVASCGRKISLDLRAKGIDESLIKLGKQYVSSLSVSAKYIGEHMGLPYHTAEIRQMEKLPRAHPGVAGARRFTRYSYADLLREDRPYEFFFRLWSGTQRILLWGDPAMAAAYGRETGFCGSAGLEVWDHLSWKGRRGSGQAEGRNLYVDETMAPERWDHEKYEYTYRLWGRLLYDPESDPDGWRRMLRREYGEAAAAVEEALSYASNVLPFLTTAHLAGGGFQGYWPEIYANMPMVDPGKDNPYQGTGDTREPRTFQAVEPADAMFFYRIDEFVADMIAGKVKGKVSPFAVADHLDFLAERAGRALRLAESVSSTPTSPAFRRTVVDVNAQIQIGRFFARKLRAGVAYALYEQTNDGKTLDKALTEYRAALAEWDELIRHTRRVYRDNMTFGTNRILLCGHWADRREAIAKDIENMEAQRQTLPKNSNEPLVQSALLLSALGLDSDAALVEGGYPLPPLQHQALTEFKPGKPLTFVLEVGDGLQQIPWVLLHYRHASQAERWHSVEMEWEGSRWRGSYRSRIYKLALPDTLLF